MIFNINVMIKMIKKLMLPLLLTSFVMFSNCTDSRNRQQTNAHEQKQEDNKMEWWKDAKFGMFIHWGVYAVPAGIYNGHKIKKNGEWIMNYAKIPVAGYKKIAQQFNPQKYDANEWVSLAKDAGMRYIVITSKHHDGFALFDSKVTDWDVTDATPYKKDLLKPLVKACKEQDVRIGFYYSQCQDWVHQGGAARREKATKGWANPDSAAIDKFTEEHDGHWDKAQLGEYDKYLDDIAVPQIDEILSQYGAIDILWWDTPIKMTKEQAEKFIPVIKKYPKLVTNDRLGGEVKGDLETPEQFIPATGFPDINWEVCMTMNDTWGFKSWDHNWKSKEDLLLKLSEIISKGGNFLLNVGPTAEGEIPQESVERLKYIGKWMDINGESIYGTTANPFGWLPWGRATRKGNTIYLHVYDWPKDNKIKLPLQNKVTKAYLLADKSKKLDFVNNNGSVEISVPTEAPDELISVVAVEFEGKEPEVLPVPTFGKTGIASSTDSTVTVENLFDGNPKNRWTTKEGVHKASIEVNLGEPVKIGHFAIIEPWHPIWDKKSQYIELQVDENGKWKTVYEANTNGAGNEKFLEKPVTGRKWRLKITGPKGERPVLNEWMLHRAL